MAYWKATGLLLVILTSCPGVSSEIVAPTGSYRIPNAELGEPIYLGMGPWQSASGLIEFESATLYDRSAGFEVITISAVDLSQSRVRNLAVIRGEIDPDLQLRPLNEVSLETHDNKIWFLLVLARCKNHQGCRAGGVTISFTHEGKRKEASFPFLIVLGRQVADAQEGSTPP